jgi:hypothetical protein
MLFWHLQTTLRGSLIIFFEQNLKVLLTSLTTNWDSFECSLKRKKKETHWSSQNKRKIKRMKVMFSLTFTKHWRIILTTSSLASSVFLCSVSEGLCLLVSDVRLSRHLCTKEPKGVMWPCLQITSIFIRDDLMVFRDPLTSAPFFSLMVAFKGENVITILLTDVVSNFSLFRS